MPVKKYFRITYLIAGAPLNGGGATLFPLFPESTPDSKETSSTERVFNKGFTSEELEMIWLATDGLPTTRPRDTSQKRVSMYLRATKPVLNGSALLRVEELAEPEDDWDLNDIADAPYPSTVNW